jgi:hypothetical protein
MAAIISIIMTQAYMSCDLSCDQMMVVDHVQPWWLTMFNHGGWPCSTMVVDHVQPWSLPTMVVHGQQPWSK